MTVPPESWELDLVSAVAGLRPKGPNNLLRRVNIDRDGDERVTPDDLLALIEDHNQQDSAGVLQLGLALAEWDFAQSPPWDSVSEVTPPRTEQRRAKVYQLLGLSSAVAERLDAVAPVAKMRNTIITTRWDPWYTEARRAEKAFYWPHYEKYLLAARGWRPESVAALDIATTEVVQRLSDPTADAQYQSKGLVVGYVQSGKTANFTGVIAKAIDAGYRLVIVMTGTIELLRSQTQRRLDRELVGMENLTRGLADGADSPDEFDYADDEDWLHEQFIRHGDDFLARGFPGIERMTLLHDDYKRLKQGLTRMQFHLRDRSKPFYDPENLLPSDARLLVVKKNGSVLRKLAQDLRPLKDKLAEIPALIIDDESDLASINTKDPRKTAERTAINKAIGDLLSQLKRAQLVMYTATPFANVFVDPDDPADIFPKNFMLALDRPPHYMGVRDFHDVDWNTEDDKSDPAVSNEKAYVRAVGPPVERDGEEGRRAQEMTAAIDSFVLAGAVKVFREEAGVLVYPHHTMLVHESMETGLHREQAELVRVVWGRAAYGRPQSLQRLQRLWNEDYEPVCRARAEGLPVPADFEQLIAPIGEACRRIREVGDPVLVVNSDADIQRNQQSLDFDRNSVWRILVGGAKLSRGFTVEGLTVSFYTRRALQGDTLMQAGRWFGFRHGYRDLVRLFIRRDPHDALKRVDLYEAFEGLMRDEESFRSNLADYEGFDEDGNPILEPWQVPPIVSQHLPYLKPTARSKMFNAVIRSVGDAGKLKDYYGHPTRRNVTAKRSNYELALPLLHAADTITTFTSSPSEKGVANPFNARVGVVNARHLADILSNWTWHPDYETEVFGPTRRFYQHLVSSGKVKDFVVVWPQLVKSVVTLELPSYGPGQVITRSRRQPPRLDFVGSDAKHRDAVERIAGTAKTTDDAAADALRDPGGRRGAILIYVAGDPAEMAEQTSNAAQMSKNPEQHDLVVLLSLVAPSTATQHGRSVIEWTVRRTEQHGTASVDLRN